MVDTESVTVETYQSTPVQHAWPDLRCYGCGPANEAGMQLQSYLSGDGESLVATVDPDEKYTSGAPNVAYGGFVASIVDCHSIWTAITFAHLEEGYALEDRELQYVTSELSVDFVDPTPLDETVHLTGTVQGGIGGTVDVSTEVRAGGETTARGEALTVEVGNHYSSD